jgi:tetratricopeptide (TPR) repeat protein
MVLLLGAALAPATDRDPAGASATPTKYTLPFGNDPFLPSEARSSFAQFLKPADVPTAAYCGQCHAKIYQEWRESAHANSFRTPWYTKNVNLLIDQKGIAFSRHCEGCHNPVALFSGALSTGSKVPRPFDEEGVTCVTCHAIERVQATRGLGSYVLGTPSALVDEKGEPVAGMPAPAEILAHLDRHRAAVQHTVMSTPEFCGSCHKANLPQSLNGYKWLRAFTTYDEWQQSGWSGQTPISFFKPPAKSCQTCHMPMVAGPDPAARNGLYNSHRWTGANTLIPAQYGYPDQQKAVETFLKNGALRVDIFALSANGTPLPGKHPAIGPVIAPLDQSTFNLRGGQGVTVSVVVQNTGIGHSLVPEQRDFYESWIAFEVRDENGRMIYRSGAVGPDHRLQPDTHVYGNQIVAKDGQRLQHHEVWKVEARAYDSTVNAGRADLERYCFTIPADAKRLTIHAAVKYRRFRREFTDWVFDDKPSDPDRGPTVTMAEDTVSLNVGENLPRPPAAGATPLMTRLTAFGVALLDHAEFPAAEQTFRRMVDLQPAQAAGYLDLGVALYQDGKFQEALDWLAKARRIEPENLRERYFEGLCYRWLYRYPEAIEALSTVARGFPRFRQVHDDLGWVYLIQREYGASRDEFEAALAVDPDDVMAHKWLSAVYLKLGDPARAAEQAAQESQIKDDPAAQWRVLAYWRSHLDVAAEVTPGHVHGDWDGKSEVERILNTQNPPSLVWIQR